MTTNRERASRCEEAIGGYGDDDLATNLIDFLCDAMHWADHNGQDFHFLVANAGRHYVHELSDQQTDGRRLRNA
jgi:hypothetical protein